MVRSLKSSGGIWTYLLVLMRWWTRHFTCLGNRASRNKMEEKYGEKQISIIKQEKSTHYLVNPPHLLIISPKNAVTCVLLVIKTNLF